jgi:hypothetical protein
MQKYLILILFFVSIPLAEYNDSIVNYIFKNRDLWQKYFHEKDYNWAGFLEKRDYERENIWQKESLFTINAKIDSYYKYKEEIIWSISRNRKLTKEPAYFNVVLPLIKDGRLDLAFLRDNIPADMLVKNKGSVKNLLLYLMKRDSILWQNDEKYRDNAFNYKGYTETAVLAQLDSIYNYKIIPLWDSYVKDILNACEKNTDEFQKKRFITAKEFLKIVDTCSNKKIKERVISYIENTSDSITVRYVNKNYSKERLIADFLENPSDNRNNNRLRRLADSSVISQLVPYLISVKKGKDTDFVYFKPLQNLLQGLYYDFDLIGKYYFSPGHNYELLKMFYRPQYHNNRMFSELYSENYIDYVKQYGAWIKKKFGQELKRKPQPDDIIDMSPAFSH